VKYDDSGRRGTNGIYIRTKFGEDISKGCRVMAIYVFQNGGRRHLQFTFGAGFGYITIFG